MSLGGSRTAETKLPGFVDSAQRDAIARSQQAAQIGYTPYYGPDVAAFTPMQNAAFGGANQAAAAFGMPVGRGNGMPAPQTFAGGVQGYSSAPGFDASLAELQQRAPGQFNAIRSMFVDPQAGGASSSGLLGNVPQGQTSQGQGKQLYGSPETGQFFWDGKKFVRA
jgi:hypothetical protein